MKRILIGLVAIFANFFAATIFAADLIDVYQQALRSDPAFKAANAQWLAQRELSPIARASLLPQLSATGNIARNHNSVQGGFVNDQNVIGGSRKFYSNAASYSLSLTQPIFNFSNWASLRGANASVKQAGAEFASAAQDLMFRVASAYFSVLQSQDVLRYTQEQKKAVGEQLRQQKQRYEVGLIPITDVNDAQASYDSIVAQEIAAQNDLQNQEEKLQEITNIKYKRLSTLQTNLPLVSPYPKNIEQWVNTSIKQNYALLAARYATIVAREDVSVQAGGHFPILNATGGFGYDYNSNAGGQDHLSRNKNTEIGLTVDVPLFQGGAVSARTQQSGYLYQRAIATQEKTYRSTVSGTRQAYLGVMSGISKIKADRQAVKSKASSLESRKNAYSAGLRTMVEVLQAESDLYDAQRNYSNDQYTYLLQTLTLKQQAGTLSVADLEKINCWLRDTGMLLDTSISSQQDVETESATTNDGCINTESNSDNNKINKQKQVQKKQIQKKKQNKVATPTTCATVVTAQKPVTAAQQQETAPVSVAPNASAPQQTTIPNAPNDMTSVREK